MKNKYLNRVLLFPLLLLGLYGCSYQDSRKSSLAKQDSLMSIVEQRIQEKKDYELFRERVLPKDFQQKIENYYPVIKKYAKRYGIDWRLIVVQILKESRFKEDARSNVGAMGLMQIMPSTAKDIRREMDIEYIINNPRENIAAGIYHLYKQLKFFSEADRTNRLKLALAAYNSGAGRIFDAQSIARYQNLDPQTWESVRYCLPKLTSKDWRIHLEVWELGVPTYGYFYGFEQTIDYVDKISEHYQVFRKIY